jgi:hypothetical protein
LYLLRGVDSIGGFPTLLYPKRGMAMSKIFRLGVVLTLAGIVSLATESRFAVAQRINFGNQNSNNNNRDDDDENRDDDEERDDEENNNQGSRGNRSSRSSTEEQVQQFLQRRQTGQNNQNQGQQSNTQQFRRGNQQGGIQIDNGQFQGGRLQDGQFQQFRPQDGQQGLRFGNWQGNNWQGSRKVDNWAQVFGSGKQPFSREWYDEHPKAWRHDEHDHDDVWITATLPGVYTWLGWGNAPGVRIGTQPGVDLSRFHNFYPLGVYSLMSGPGDMGTRIVQLSIDRHGHISGNYYDLITDTNSSISGDVRRDSQRVYWHVNKNRSIRFRASLNRLLQPYGTVVVQMPGGEQDWQFVRLER